MSAQIWRMDYARSSVMTQEGDGYDARTSGASQKSDFMASVRVRPLGWVSFKKREVAHVQILKAVCFLGERFQAIDGKLSGNRVCPSTLAVLVHNRHLSWQIISLRFLPSSLLL